MGKRKKKLKTIIDHSHPERVRFDHKIMWKQCRITNFWRSSFQNCLFYNNEFLNECLTFFFLFIQRRKYVQMRILYLTQLKLNIFCTYYDLWHWKMDKKLENIQIGLCISKIKSIASIWASNQSYVLSIVVCPYVKTIHCLSYNSWTKTEHNKLTLNEAKSKQWQ